MMNYLYNIQLEQLYDDVLEMGELGFENASQKDIFHLRTMAKKQMLYNSLPDKARDFLNKLRSGSVELILDYGIGRTKMSYKDLIQEVILNDFSPLDSSNIEEKRELKNFQKFFRMADCKNEDYRDAEYVLNLADQKLNNQLASGEDTVIDVPVKIEGADIQRAEILESEKEFLNIREAAVLLQLQVSTVYSKNCRGEIPGVSKPGKHLLFSKKALLEWIEASRKKTDAELKAEASTYLKRR